MSWNSPEFIILIVAISTFGWVVNNWIRARHGYALEDEFGGKTVRPDLAENVRLAEENERLTHRLVALEQRTATLETIVTDGSYQLAGSIEALRDNVRDRAPVKVRRQVTGA